MRVCYVTNGLKKGHYHYAQNLIEGLAEIGDVSVDTYFINDTEAAAFPSADTARPLATSMRDSFIGNVFYTLFYHVRFFLYLIFARPDVVHFNTVFRNQYHTYVLTIMGKITGIRVVRTVHEVTDKRLRSVSHKERLVAYRHLQACDHLIVHSADVNANLESNGVLTPTTVLPHGNYLFFRQYLDPDEGPPLPVDDDTIVLFFGPKKHKGVDVFAEALARTNRSFTTWIAGPISDDATAAVSDIESLSGTYVDRGYVADEDLPAYFEHADVVVLPYQSGTTSGAVHLARAFETTVVTSPLPCFTNVVEHGVDGYILTENTPTALAEALDELVCSPDMSRDLAVEGLKTEQSPRFDWGRIGRETAEIYSPT